MTIGTDLHPSYIVGTWKLDLAHSELTFSVKHLAISKVRGSFNSFDVTIVTADNFADSTIGATIDIAFREHQPGAARRPSPHERLLPRRRAPRRHC